MLRNFVEIFLRCDDQKIIPKTKKREKMNRKHRAEIEWKNKKKKKKNKKKTRKKYAHKFRKQMKKIEVCFFFSTSSSILQIEPF